MKKVKATQDKLSKLRRQAEATLELKPEDTEDFSHLSHADKDHLLNELRVNQAELEMQNEELRQTQLELEAFRDKHSDLYDFAPVGFFTINAKGIILEVNLTSAAMLGSERNFLIGKPFSQFITRNTQDTYYLYRNKLLKTNTKQTCELRLVKKDGTQFYVQLDSIVVEDAEGNVNQIRISASDITDRKLAEGALSQKTHDLDKRVKELNCFFSLSNLVETPRITMEEILQGTVDLIPPAWQYPEITCAQIILEEKEFHTKNYKDTIWKLNSNIFVHGIKHGSLTVCYLEEKSEMGKGPFLKEEQGLINAIAERMGKVVERRWAEEALKESEERFRDLVENSLIGVCIIQNDQVVYQNPEQARLLGPLPRSYLLEDIDKIHPDDFEKVKGLSQDINSLKIRTLDTEFRLFPGGKKDRKDNMKWVHCRANLTKYRGETALLVNMMDITRSKELENIIRIQDKMASLGRVAAGIAHEIRNPLSGINIYINTLEKLYDKGESLEKVKKIFRHLQSASVKIESVIRRVMDFSKPSEPKFVLTEINQPVEEAILLTEATLRKSGIKIEKELGQDLPKCYADKHMIEEVILNLINNAADAMKIVAGEKKIMITTAMIKSQIFIRIIDSGPGVSEHQQDRIFDPFYTTKSESTGIGLSLCHRIIADHGGSMSIGSSKWGGAEFITKIPIDSAKDEP